MTIPPGRDNLVQLRGWTEAEWLSTDPVLARREPGWAVDTGVLKIGDGLTAWSALPPLGGGGDAAPLAALGAPLAAGAYYAPTGGATTGIPPEATMRGSPLVVGRDCSLSRLATSITVVGTTGAVIRLGAYLWVGDDWELLADAGTIQAETGTGVKEIAGLDVPVTAGDVILPVAAVQGGAGTRPTCRQIVNNYGPMVGGTATSVLDNATGGFNATGVAGALPATASWGNTTNPTKVAIRADA